MRPEVAELRQYEDTMDRHPAKTDQTQDEVSAPAPQRLTATLVRQVALDCETMPQAEGCLGVEDLAGQLEANKRLAGAWDKGRRLRDIRAIAVTPICMEEASKRLGMGPEGLVKLYRRDPDVRDIWDRGKVDMAVRLKQGLMARATAGKPDALRTVEQILAGEFAGPPGRQMDFGRLTPTQMAEATGFARQQILRWHKGSGLPRNVDGRTYSLPAFVTWFEQFIKGKVTGTTTGPNRLQNAKAERLELELAKRRGELVEVESVKAGLLARERALVAILEHKPEELSHLIEGKTRQQIRPVLEKFAEDLRREWFAAIEVETTKE